MGLLWPIMMQAMRNRGRVAVVDDQRPYTYGQLLGGSMFVAEQIEAVTPNPLVGILLPTSGAFPVALLACWLAGRTAVPLNYLLKPRELAYVIQDSGIDTILTTAVMLDFVRNDDEDPIGPNVRLLCLEDLDFTGWPPLRWPPASPGDDLAVILYTSGTSGLPKGVMLTHSNLHSNVEAAIVHAELTEADTFLGVLPQFHSFGLTALTLLPLRLGSKIVYHARFIPRKIVSLIRKHRPDIFMAIPSMYGALLSVKDLQPDDFASIRLPISGGEPLPNATYDTYLERFNLRILEGYGLTETAPICNWCTMTRHRLHSVGPAIPGVEIRIVDEKDRMLPANAEGEVLIAGPNIMKGYYHLPQQTAEVFVNLISQTANGGARTKRFFRTGDIGKLDHDGFLYITGRKKEMLIVGGENLFPREIEEVLNKHESVAASAVIGKTDGVRGEVPVAFVELNQDSTFDDSALRAWCRQSLAGYKVPRQIRQIDQLPRNPTGKILRRELNAED